MSDSISIDKDNRIFRTDIDQFLFYSGTKPGDSRAFIRIGPPLEIPFELNAQISKVVLPKKNPGNLGMDGRLAQIYEELLQKENFQISDEQILTGFITDSNLLRRIFTLLGFSNEDGIHLTQAYKPVAMSDVPPSAKNKDATDFKSLSYTNGNIQILQNGKAIFDYDKIIKKHLSSDKIIKLMEKADQGKRKANSELFEDGGAFGARFSDSDFGFICPKDVIETKSVFENKDNYKFFPRLSSLEKKQNNHFIFQFASDIAVVNPVAKQHAELFRKGWDINKYKIALSNDVFSSGLFELLAYKNIANALAPALTPPAEASIYYADEEREGTLRQVYKECKLHSIKDERKITPKSAVRFFENKDKSLILFQIASSANRKRQVIVPFANGNYNPGFNSDENSVELIILPYIEEGYGDTNPSLVLHQAKQKGQKKIPLKIRREQKGVYELIPDSKYKISDPANPARFFQELSSVLGEKEVEKTLKDILNEFLVVGNTSALEYNLKVFAKHKTPDDIITYSNIVEIIRFLGNQESFIKQIDEKSLKLFEKIEKKYSPFKVEKLPALYEQTRHDWKPGFLDKIKLNLSEWKNELQEKWFPEWEEIDESAPFYKISQEKYELAHKVLFYAEEEAYLLRLCVKKDLITLPFPHPHLSEDERTELKGLMSKTMSFAENAEQRQTRLEELLKIWSKLIEDSEDIRQERKRLNSFLDQIGIKRSFTFFRRPQAKNWQEKVLFFLQDKWDTLNTFLSRLPFFNKFKDDSEESGKESSKKKSIFSPAFVLLLSLLLFIFLIIAIVSISSSDENNSTEKENNIKSSQTHGEDLKKSGFSESDIDVVLNNTKLRELVNKNPKYKKLILMGRKPGLGLMQEVHEFSRVLAAYNGYSLPGEKTNAGKKNPDLIFPGDKLKIPSDGEITVKESQTIWQISTIFYAKYLEKIINAAENSDNDEVKQVALTRGLKNLLKNL